MIIYYTIYGAIEGGRSRNYSNKEGSDTDLLNVKSYLLINQREREGPHGEESQSLHPRIV